MSSSQEMWKLVLRDLIQKTHGRAWICMFFPIKISWDHGIRGRYFLCSGRRGCPVFFHVLPLLVSLLHTERVQGRAGVCRLEMKPNLQTSAFWEEYCWTVVVILVLFRVCMLTVLPPAAKPLACWAALATWAAADQLEEALLGNNESTCEVWMEIHGILNFRWRLEQQPVMLEGRATTFFLFLGLGMNLPAHPTHPI